MKNLRKILSLVLVVAMVISTNAVSYAATMTAAQKAETLGVIKGEGSGVTSEYLAKTPTRIQAVIISLRLRGLEDEAIAYDGSEVFSDQDDIAWDDGKTIASYVKANPELGWIGTDGALLPNQTITAQQFVKVMLEALGYAQGVDFEWAEVFTFASSVGLRDLSATTKMTNESLAIGMIEALGAKTKAGSVLVDDLVASGAINARLAEIVGLIEVDSDFALKSVESFGLNAVKIIFTSDVDEDEEIVIEVEEDGDEVTVDPDYQVYDNVIVVVFGDNDTDNYNWSDSDAETQGQSTELDLIISAVGKDGIDVDEEEASVKMNDKEDPELLSVTVDNAKTIVVKYSEPIIPSSYEHGKAVFDEVFIDSTKVVGKATWSDDLTTITYVLNNALDSDTYTFTTEAVEDFAGFIAPSETVTIVVEGDDDAPQILRVDFVSNTELVLVFDEEVEDIGDVEVDGDEVASVEIDDEEVTITLQDKLTASNAFVSVEITWEDVEDLIGNKDDGEIMFKAPIDDKAPTVDVEVSSDNELVFIFSEEVTGFEVDDITVYDDDDNEVDDFFSGSVKEDETDIDDYDDEEEDPTIYYINLANPDDVSGEYTIEIDGSSDEIEDLSVIANDLKKTEVAVEFEDTSSPEIEQALIIDGNWDDDDEDETVRIVFSEAMDIDSLEDVDNYILDDEALDSYDDYDIDVDTNGMYVDIMVEGEELDGLTMMVYGVEDEDGNGIAVSDSTVVIDFAPSSFTGASFELVDLDEIKVTLDDDAFIDVDPDDFILYEADGDTKINSMYVVSAEIDEDDDSIAYLTLSDDLMADGSTELTVDGSLLVMVKVIEGDTVNIYDVPLVQAAKDLDDGVKPSVEIEFEDNDNDDLLFVRFDEAVTASESKIDSSMLIYNEDDGEYVDPSDLGITFYDAEDDVVNASSEAYVYFTLDLVADDEYTIELLSRYIVDANGNVAEGVDEDSYYPE